jgi:hypothetical protein
MVHVHVYDHMNHFRQYLSNCVLLGGSLGALVSGSCNDTVIVQYLGQCQELLNIQGHQ